MNSPSHRDDVREICGALFQAALPGHLHLGISPLPTKKMEKKKLIGGSLSTLSQCARIISPFCWFSQSMLLQTTALASGIWKYHRKAWIALLHVWVVPHTHSHTHKKKNLNQTWVGCWHFPSQCWLNHSIMSKMIVFTSLCCCKPFPLLVDTLWTTRNLVLYVILSWISSFSRPIEKGYSHPTRNSALRPRKVPTASVRAIRRPRSADTAKRLLTQKWMVTF